MRSAQPPPAQPSSGEHHPADGLQVAYAQLCESYRAIDDFRSKLLGFLPFVSGAGVLALLGPLEARDQGLLRPIGWFGFLVTVGLFAFELHGIRKCHALITAGRALELGLSEFAGLFRVLPDAIVNEPFAAGIVYPTVAATWLYVALEAPESLWGPLLCAAVGFAGTVVFDQRYLQRTQRKGEK